MPLNKIYKSLLVISGFMMISLSLCAWSVSDYYLGNQISSFSARNLGMGNTGVYDTFSPMSLSLNPANVTLLNGRAGFSATGMFTRNEDNRSIPLYNSFDTFIDDATISANTNLFDDYGFAGYGKYKLNKYILGLGFHYLPMVNFKGTYDEEVRNNRNSDNDTYPEIIAMNAIDNTGKLNAMGFTFGGGMETDNGISAQLGLTMNIMGGESEMQKSVKWSDYAISKCVSAINRNVLADSVYTHKSEYSGTQINIGTALKVNNRIGFGIAYSVKSSLDRDVSINKFYGPDTTSVTNVEPVISDTLYNDKYIMPARIRMGFNYMPRNIMKTYFNAEFEYVYWSDISGAFENSWDIHVGVEHSVTNRIPLRLGFQSLTEWQAVPDYNYLNEEGLPVLFGTKIITPSITAGSSVELVKNLVLDIGLSFSWREYQALDMFRDGYYDDRNYTGLTSYIPDIWPNSYIYPTDRGWENADKVRESFTQFSTGITWTW